MEPPKVLSQTLTGQNHKLDENMTEAEMQQKMIRYLGKFFVVSSEVWSTDKKRRIDLIICHKSDMNKEYPIGIEIKLAAKKRGKDLALWLQQASDYSTKNFSGFGKCLIVSCPQISGYYMREGERMNQHETPDDAGSANNIGTFLGQFNIGEFQKYMRNTDTLYRIVYKGQIIWDANYDSFRPHNYIHLCPR